MPRSTAALMAPIALLLGAGCGPASSLERPRPPTPRRRAIPAPRQTAHQELEANVARYRRSLRRCHELALAEDWRVGGRLQLVLHVAPAGVVTRIRVKENTSESRLLARCVSHVARSFVFDTVEAGFDVNAVLRFRAPRAKYTVRLDDVPPRRGRAPGVSGKVVLTARSVSSGGIALAVVRLDRGAVMQVPPGQSVLGIHVLQGFLGVRVDGPPLALSPGEGATLVQGDHAARLEAAAGGRTAALLFVAPPGAEQTILPPPKPDAAPQGQAGAEQTSARAAGDGDPAQAKAGRRGAPALAARARRDPALMAKSPMSRIAWRAARARRHPALMAKSPMSRIAWRAARARRHPAKTRPRHPSGAPPRLLRPRPAPISGGVISALGGRAPVPRAITLAPGQTATVSPLGRPVHHALLVTRGGLWIRMMDVRLPAEAGMAVSLPAGASATLRSATRSPAGLVIMPWPSGGAWPAAAPYPLMRLETLDRRPRRGKDSR